MVQYLHFRILKFPLNDFLFQININFHDCAKTYPVGHKKEAKKIQAQILSDKQNHPPTCESQRNTCTFLDFSMQNRAYNIYGWWNTGIPTPLKNRKVGWGDHSQLNGKIKIMFQTTNQYNIEFAPPCAKNAPSIGRFKELVRPHNFMPPQTPTSAGARHIFHVHLLHVFQLP